jgi:hypothetical protein
VLVFNERIYDRSLPPTICAGGTVDYVGIDSQDFIKDIEEREKAGTPGVLQTFKAALALQIKDRVGVERIHARELELTQRAFSKWSTTNGIEILGNPDPTRRVGIISFNLKSQNGNYLHHKFVTALLNDLFGIQSRAGCSCAGPYGHRLLDIDNDTSERYRDVVRHGHCGMKPGWCRVGLHWVMDDAEADFVIEAVMFLASYGHLFLPLYNFDLSSGTWTHKNESAKLQSFSLDAALSEDEVAQPVLTLQQRMDLYAGYITAAHRWAEKLQGEPTAASETLQGELGDLQFFPLPRSTAAGR